MKAVRLRTNSLDNPVGVSDARPGFSWEIAADGFNRRQTAWRIRCCREPSGTDACLWDSGRVEGDRQLGVEYTGAELGSRDLVYWRVLIWDEKGAEGEWSNWASFELGLLQPADWQAKWIDPQPDTIDPDTRYPASVLARTFTLENAPNTARLYITAHGLYRASLNGRPVTDAVLTPGCTSYHHRLQVQTWDVGELLVAGENHIEVTLGDGWFRGRVGAFGSLNVYGERLALLAQLEVSLNGTRAVACATDETWKASQDGPIRENDLKDGLRVDARRTPEGWHGVAVRDHGYEQLTGTDAPVVREREEFRPEVLTTPDGNTVLDFGQNIAGYVSFTVEGEAGDTVKLTHGEVLDENGNFTMKNLELGLKKFTPVLQQITYTLAGGGPESFKPLFTFHGFRYVLLEGWPEEVRPERFTAHAIYSDIEQIGFFSCSNDLVNRLVLNALWSQKGNFVDIPTDCPQRERAGWSGDAQVYSRAGSYLMESAAFLKKWLRDLAAEQHENGMVPNISPAVGFDTWLTRRIEGSAGWGDAAVIVPWVIWKVYGDRSVLEEQWESMKAWVDYEAACARKTHWIRLLKPNPFRRYTWDTKYHWGEWLEPGVPLKKVAAGVVKRMLFSEPEVATAYLAYSSRLLSEIADELGKPDEARRYRELAENAAKAYRYSFTKDGRIRSSRQCRYVRPVALGLLSEPEQQAAVDELAGMVAQNGYRIGTGFLTTPYICRTLSDRGHADVAYGMVEQTSIPGWLYPVTKGATTIWETWTGIDENGVPSASHNHYTYGAVAGWFLDTVAGIDTDPGSPGFSRFILAPRPGGSFTHAEGRYHSVRGLIASAWKREGERVRYTFTIPANTTARVVLPCSDLSSLTIHGGQVGVAAFAKGRWGTVETELGSGTYEISCALDQAPGPAHARGAMP